MSELSVLSANLRTLKSIFRPASPTDDQKLFRGRDSQLRSLMVGLAEQGQHIIIYGERGVGKTSLGYMAKALFDSDDNPYRVSVRVQCADGQSFTQVWQDFYVRLRIAVDRRSKEIRDYLSEAMDTVDEIINYPNADDLTATDVHRAIALLSDKCELLIIVDEFDRLGAWDETTPFGDLIKSLSDERVQTTLVLVGVADSIDGLIKAHASTPRSLRSIMMPRMEQDVLLEIVTEGYAEFCRQAEYELSCDSRAAKTIARVAQGFPYYAHLLAGAAGTEAIYRDMHRITVRLVFESMVLAIEDADYAIRSTYVGSITARSDANLEHTLVACALAKSDDLGFFSSRDVAESLSEMVKEKRKPGHVNSHLARFSDKPYWVLERKEISTRNIRYRFIDPLMRPFVLLKGYQANLIPGDDSE